MVSEIDNKIAKLKEALGDDEIEIKSDEDTTEVKTDDTTVETNASECKGEECEDKETDEDKDEVAEFEKELEADLDKYKK